MDTLESKPYNRWPNLKCDVDEDVDLTWGQSRPPTSSSHWMMSSIWDVPLFLEPLFECDSGVVLFEMFTAFLCLSPLWLNRQARSCAATAFFYPLSTLPFLLYNPNCISESYTS
jgi:hypothetical protein